jgi:predicted transcriptional regulator
MAGRICGICAHSETMKRAAELIATGLSDQKIANQLGLPTSAGRMLVSRHRRYHIEAPARIIAEAAGKGRANVEQREQTVAAAESGDVAAAFLSLNQLVKDLMKVQLRLERTADAAEVDKQRLAVASLSAQTTWTCPALVERDWLNLRRFFRTEPGL